MKQFNKKFMSFLLVGAMALSLVACGDTTSDDTTTPATTTKAPVQKPDPNASINQKVVSDYEVESVKNKAVKVGTSFEDVVASLPSELQVTIPGEASGEATELFKADFSNMDSFTADWTLCDNDGVAAVDGKFATTAASDKIKAYVTEPEWAKADGEEYANYVIKAVLRGQAEAPDHNFGIIFRAANVTAGGPDSYDGMYVGIGDPSGQICVGKASNNAWHHITNIDFDYVPNQDYTLEVVVYNDTFVVLLDGVAMYEGAVDPAMINGTVGLRTYKQLFECSEFSVRTLSADDFNHFEAGFTEVKSLPVVWTCSDYDPNKTGSYGFFGTITEGLPSGKQAQVKVRVSVREE
ncbi:MAG: hypothetical protein J6R82_01845 [Clostridia bacterium]|nr:hypothetical protein [Clostridia bacterium]